MNYIYPLLLKLTIIESFSPILLQNHLQAYKKANRQHTKKHYDSLLFQTTLSLTTVPSTTDTENTATKIANKISSTESLNGKLQSLCNNNLILEAKALLEEMMKLSSETGVVPDVTSYTIVISNLSKTKNKSFCNDGYALYQHLVSSTDIKMTLLCYNAVLDGLATLGKYEIANELLNSMTVKPDVISYNCVLNAYSRLGMGKEAQELLYSMFYNRNKLGFVPNEISYTTTLLAWSRSCSADIENNNNYAAAEKAQELLQTIQKWSDDNDNIVPPSIFCYNSVLFAWSKTKNGAVNAERFLRTMLSQENNIAPNKVSYNTVLSAWVKHTSIKAPYKAEELLNEMQLSSSIDTKPNLITFNTVMDCWAKKTRTIRNAAQRCELVLRYMEEMYRKTGDDSYKPDVCSYSTVINAYAQSKMKGCAHSAENVLNDMLKNGFDVPNSVIFNTVINAWSKSGGEKDAAIRAHAILDHMEELSQSKDEKYKYVRPDVFSYTSVMDTYAKIGTKESASKAYNLLRKIEQLYNSTNDKSIQPNIKTYTSLINAFSRSKQPYDAQNVIQQMNDFANVHNIQSLKMDVITYNALINSWGWSDEHTIKAKEAYNIYNTMKESKDIKPDLITINSILNACAFTKTDDSTIKKDVIDIAIELYEEITSPLSSIKSSDTTYGTMIIICGNLLNDNTPLRNEILQSIFWKCCNDGYVSYFVISQLRSVLQSKVNGMEEYGQSMELYQKLVLDYCKIDTNNETHASSSKNEMFGYVDIMNLPKQWTSKIVHTGKQKFNKNNKRSKNKISS